MALTPPPAAPQRGDRATFAQRVDAFITWLIGFVSELNIFSANLNSIAEGSVFSIPFIFRNDTAYSNTTGCLVFGNGAIDLNNLDARQIVVRDMLIAMIGSSTSSSKAQITIRSSGNPTRYRSYNILELNSYPNYVSITVSLLSENTLFDSGELVLLSMQRTGDKGDTGAAAINPSAKFSDRKSSGVSGGTNVTGEQVRTLNTTDYNTAGVTLSGNQVTIQPGTYEIQGRAPAHAVGYHRVSLYNVTDGTPALVGSSEYASPAGGVQSSSAFMGRIVLATAKTFSVRHYTGQATTSTGLGNAVSVSGVNETYTELNITKVA